jgi:hypothetical protein
MDVGRSLIGEIEVPSIILKDENNFYSWSCLIHLYFRCIGAYKYLEKMHSVSEVMNDPIQRLAFFEASRVIYTTVSPHLRHFIQYNKDDDESQNPYILNQKIEDYFLPIIHANRHRLKRQFYLTQLEENENVSHFGTKIEINFNHCNKSAKFLSNTEKKNRILKKDDNILVDKLMSDIQQLQISNPSRHKTIIEYLSKVHNDTEAGGSSVSIERMKQSLTVVAKISNNESERVKQRHNRDTKRETRTCRFCHKVGHIEDECRKKKRSQQNDEFVEESLFSFTTSND